MHAESPADERTSDGDESLAGRTVGHYRIVEELGHGGMGRVYLAEDTTLDRRVALKVLAAAIARDRPALRRFEREAKILAALAHPNIAMVHSLEEEAGLRFFTMELVPGRTLHDLVSGRPLPVDMALALGRQVASALEAAHGNGVVHGDLKPSNIRVTPDDRIKVLDFGLAREIRQQPSAGSDDATELRGGFAGTPGYMSPEQLRQLLPDERTDLWGLGCVLFECLTGRPAFPGATGADRVAAVLDREPDWSVLPAETGTDLLHLLRACLAKDPDERPAGVREVRRALEEEIARRRYGVVHEPAEKPPGCVHNLPRRLDAFIGREREVRTIGRLIEEVPLLTLTGAGGCGKSRLAIEVARGRMGSFPGGVWLVELAPLGDPARVPHAVARALGCKEIPRETIGDALVRFLQGRKALLILDNCEHLLAATAELAETLMRSCPELMLLATSRETLGIAGEARFHVPSLAVPQAANESGAALEPVESVRLFAERARAGQTGFRVTDDNAPAVAQICRRLDGIPLALELAAARVRTMTPAEIARRLDDRFSLLTEGSRTSLPRHHTLRALIDWSWDLLEPAERTLLQRLSVFAGGWTLDAAERVCSGPDMPEWRVVDLHSRLVEKSLVEMTAEGPGEPGRSRYRILETVRQYARELTDPASDAEVRRRHRDFYLAMAEEAEPQLRGAEQTRWLARLGVEHENLRTAFATALADPDGATETCRLAGALGRYWMVRGHWTEGNDQCREALRKCATPTDARARTLNAAGNLAFHLGRYDEAGTHHADALEIRRLLGNRHDEAMSLNNLGEVARLRGDYARAAEYYRQAESIQREIDDRWGLAVSLNNLGEVAQNQGDYEAARTYHEQACSYWPELGDRWGLAFSLSNLGFVASKRRRFDEARDCYQRTLSLARELGDRYKIALALRQLGEVATEQRDWESAARSLHESLNIRRELGDREGVADSLESVAVLLTSIDHPAPAARLLGAAEVIRELIRAPAPAGRREDLVRAADELARSLGVERCRLERDRGRGLGLGDAVALALEHTAAGLVVEHRA
jgi:non-specific serine/threonine protein kinase